MFGPITTLRKDGRLVKHLPWTAFKLADEDWKMVANAAAVLEVRNYLFPFDPTLTSIFTGL